MASRKYKNRYINPGDDDLKVKIEFSLAELISLQSIIHAEMEHDRQENIEVLPTVTMFDKIEYFIVDLELQKSRR